MQYTLRFTPRKRQPRELQLQLCTACLNELRTDPDVEMVGDPDLGVANLSSR